MTGETATVHKAIFHEIIKEISIPRVRLRKASARTEIVSVVMPLRAETSSESTFVRIPGARSSLSNQLTCLKRIPRIRSRRTLNVRFSPVVVNIAFSIPVAKPIRMQRPRKSQRYNLTYSLPSVK